MLAANIDQPPQLMNKLNTFTAFPQAIEAQPDRKLHKLLAELSPETPWGDRRRAAQTLGHMRSPEALPGLLDALPADPSWVVRCVVIQALESIGDPQAIPTLREIAKSDGFLLFARTLPRQLKGFLKMTSSNKLRLHLGLTLQISS